MTSVAPDRGGGGTDPVDVGYFGKPQDAHPSVPEGYRLLSLDLASTSRVDDLAICIVSVTPEDAGTTLREVRLRVGEPCFLIAHVREGLGDGRLARLIDLGADEVLSETAGEQRLRRRFVSAGGCRRP